MSDTPPDRPADGPPDEDARSEDAVFEEVRYPTRPGDGAGPLPSWSAVPASDLPVLNVPAVQVGDPFEEPSGDGQARPGGDAMGYTPQDGFRIDFDQPEPAAPGTSTALAPIRRPLPAPRPAGGSAPPPAGPPTAPRAEARRSARDKMQMLSRHKGLIVGLTLAGLALGAAASVLLPPTFKAHSLLLINSGTGEGAGGTAMAPGAEESRVRNQALVLQQAPEIAIRTATAILARTDATALSTVQDATARYGTPVTAEALADHLQEDVVTVEPAADEADVIRVEAAAGQPQEAALIATLYTDEYQSLTESSLRERTAQTRQALDEQIARREGELDEIERQLEAYMTAENAAGLDEQTRVTVSSIGQLQSQLDFARVEVQTNRAQLAQLRADLASVPQRLERSAQAPSPVSTADVDTEIAQVERLLEQIYAQNPGLRTNPRAHPDVAALDARLQGLRADRRDRVESQTRAAVDAGGLDLSSDGANGQAYVASLQQQISTVAATLAGAEARVATLAGRLGEARGQLRAVPGQQFELGQLQRQQATTAATLAQLRAEADRAGLAETTERGFVQVVRAVQVPREPTGAGLPGNLAVGGILGLLLGLGIAFVRYQTDSRVRVPGDLREQGFTVVGTVPDFARAAGGERQPVEGALLHPALVAVTRPFAPEAEAFRHLHATLYAGGPSAPQVVLVASPDAEAGKSVVASNLAAVAAQAGRRTLLVDADLRRPSVTGLFGLGEHAPLGEGPEGTNFVYWSTAVPGLFAMTPREAAQRPDQMWTPDQVGALLGNLRSAFDLVIVDSAAALTSADAALIAPYADAALLVAEADSTDVEAMTQVATELAGVGLSRVGAVLNRFDARSAVGYRSTAGVRHAA